MPVVFRQTAGSVRRNELVALWQLEPEGNMSETHDPIAGAYFNALLKADSIVMEFEKQRGYKPTEIHHAIAASLFIEKNRAQNRPQRTQGAQTQPSTPQPTAPMVTECPTCGGAVWNNLRKNAERRASGQKELPMYSCRDKDGCGWAMWRPKPKQQPVTQPAETPWQQEAQDQASDLPF